MLTITFLHILLCSGTWGALGYPPCSVITRSLAAFTILVEYWSVSMSMNSEKLLQRRKSFFNSIIDLLNIIECYDHLLGTKLNWSLHSLPAKESIKWLYNKLTLSANMEKPQNLLLFITPRHGPLGFGPPSQIKCPTNNHLIWGAGQGPNPRGPCPKAERYRKQYQIWQLLKPFCSYGHSKINRW